MKLHNVFCSVILITTTAGDLHIGAIFDNEDLLLEAAFRVAVAVASEGREEAFVPEVSRTSPGELSEVIDAGCELVEKGLLAIFGPTNKRSIEHLQSMCDTLEIPQILYWPIETITRNWSALSFYPHHSSYARIFADLIKLKKWTEFTILFEGSEHLLFLNDVITLQHLQDDYIITIIQLPEDGDYRPILDNVKRSGEVNFIIDCSIEKLPALLEQAQQVGIIADAYSYIIVTPDLQSIDLESFKFGGANITGMRLFNPGDEVVANFASLLKSELETISEGQITDEIAPESIKLEAALVYDATMLLVKAIDTLEISEAKASCEDNKAWISGLTVVNFMRSAEAEGITGKIQFDEEGFRSDFVLEIVELTPPGLSKVGTWNPNDGYEDKRVYVPEAEKDGTVSMKGKHFIVIISLTAPYGMRRESSKTLEGNEQYEGFGVELFDELANFYGFNYTLEIQFDGVYGSLDKNTGKWNGMMEKVMNQEVDFAITDLTITADRQKAVDFTSPFLNLGISILYKKPTKQPPDLFSFISPFSTEVWGWLAGAYAGVSVLLFVIGRMAPEEWQNPYPCIEDPETLDNQWTLANSFWFTLGSVLTQGSEIAPIATSTRIAGSVWWFFTLIMVASYTANLAAFLTVESKFYAIKSVNDLANNPYGIKYGAKRGGSTYSFFKESDSILYQKMYKYMEDNPDVMTASNEEGLARVQSTEEEYAFLMESTSIEYIVERNCDVAQVGGLLDNKGYGIAMIKNSPYRQAMSEAILQLQEDGKITRMKDKWWKEKRGGGACSDDEGGGGEAQPLELSNVGGVFIVLAAGSGLATICALIEMVIDVWAVSIQEKVPFLDELIAELKFIASFSGDTKPVRHHTSSTNSRASDDADKAESGSKDGSGSKSKRSGSMSQSRSSKPNEEAVLSSRTSRSNNSDHSQHVPHSRRQSNSVQMARMRRF